MSLQQLALTLTLRCNPNNQLTEEIVPLLGTLLIVPFQKE